VHATLAASSPRDDTPLHLLHFATQKHDELRAAVREYFKVGPLDKLNDVEARLLAIVGED
jgi:hypothetical protein